MSSCPLPRGMAIRSAIPRPWRASIASELEDEQTRALVRQAIDKLPESHHTVLVLRDIQELDTLETAQLMGLTQGAVKVRQPGASGAAQASGAALYRPWPPARPFTGIG